MATCLLISYPGEPINPTTFIPDNGLATLAGSLLANGHHVRILDYGTVDLFRRCFPDEVRPELADIFSSKMRGSMTESQVNQLQKIDHDINLHRERMLDEIGREVVALISEINVDFVGFKAWTGDSHDGMVRIVRSIKAAYKDMPIIIGGSLVNPFVSIFLQKVDGIDFACFDEGEETIVKFADYIDGREDIRRVPNLFYVNGSGGIEKTEHRIIEELDNLPMPCYDPAVYPAIADANKFNMIVIDESRRCYFRCPFCIESAKVRSKWRAKSAARVLAEITAVRDKLGTRLIRLGGQMTPGNLLEDISRQIIEQGLDIEFTAFSHITTLKSADLELMKQAGLYALFFGVESGNQRMLQTTLGKKTKVEDIEKVLRSSVEAGIYTVASIIYPAPGDDEKTLADTVSLLKRCQVQSAPIQFAGVYPGSAWGREYQRFGFQLDPDTYADSVVSYKIKNIFPPQFWDPVPVKIDGKDFSEYTQETGKAIMLLEQAGILTDLTDEQALLAKHASLTDREFRDQSSRGFYCGDWELMRKLVKKVNQGTILDTGA